MGDSSKENGKPIDSWNKDYLGEILRANISELRRLKTTKNYEGYVSISLKQIESTGVIVGIDKRSKFQVQKSGGHAGLPTVHLDVIIDIQNLDSNLLESLSTLLDEATKSDPITLIEELEKDEDKVKQLAESDDFRARLWAKRMKEMEIIGTGLEPLVKQLESIGIRLNELEKLTPENALSLLSQSKTILKQYDTTPKFIRQQLTAQYLEYFKGLANQDKSIKCDVNTVETFGQDLFEIFRNCMNLVISFLKYDQGQFWLEELEPGAGYFYIETEVKMDGRGPLIPLSRHKHTMEMLDASFLLTENEWGLIKEELQKYNVLTDHRLSIGRIFTQAEIALEDAHLEAAIAIAHVAFEASMNQILDYFFVDKVPVSGFGKKVGLLQFIMEKASFAGLDSKDYYDLWRLIDGKPKDNRTNPRKPWDYEDGLLPVRNDLQHRSEFPDVTPRRVGEYILAARKLARHLDRWIQTKPPTDLTNSFEDLIQE